MDNKDTDRKYWTNEDWDNSSNTRKLFKETTGITLNPSLVKFTILIVVVTIIASIFGN